MKHFDLLACLLRSPWRPTNFTRFLDRQGFAPLTPAMRKGQLHMFWSIHFLTPHYFSLGGWTNMVWLHHSGQPPYCNNCRVFCKKKVREEIVAGKHEHQCLCDIQSPHVHVKHVTLLHLLLFISNLQPICCYFALLIKKGPNHCKTELQDITVHVKEPENPFCLFFSCSFIYLGYFLTSRFHCLNYEKKKYIFWALTGVYAISGLETGQLFNPPKAK